MLVADVSEQLSGKAGWKGTEPKAAGKDFTDPVASAPLATPAATPIPLWLHYYLTQ